MGEFSEDLMAGFVSAAITRTTLAPLDLLKIRFQLQTTGNLQPKYSGILSGTRVIIQEEGLRAMWKGNMGALCMSCLWTPVNFAVVRQTKGVLRECGFTNTTLNATVAGGFASVVATTLTYPLDLLRTRFAAQGEPRVYSSYATAVQRIYTRHGITGFYTGLPAACTSVVPYMAAMFGLFDAVNSCFVFARVTLARVDGRPTDQSPWEKFAAGFITGIGAKALTHPLTVMKTRLQARDFAGHLPSLGPRVGGLRGAVQYTLATEGVIGLWRGLSPALMKAGPSSALHFGIYEMIIGSSGRDDR